MQVTKPERTVVFTQRFLDDATLDYFRQNNCRIVQAELPPGQADGGLSHDQLVETLKDADGWIVGHARVTRELMTALPKLQVVARRGVGYERVDIDAANDLGKVVTIAAGGNDASVADHTIGLMLGVARRLRESQQNMIGGNWTILNSVDLNSKVVGIVGLGRIGRGVAQRLTGFGCRILAVSRTRDDEFAAKFGIEHVDIVTLLKESDYVTLHAPLRPETRFLINEASIATMKTSAIVINTGRGGLVEDRHLLEALRAGRLAGAGLDVFVSENDPDYKPVTQALLALPNVVATPHSGASSWEALARSNIICARNIVSVLDGGSPDKVTVVADGRPRKHAIA